MPSPSKKTQPTQPPPPPPAGEDRDEVGGAPPSKPKTKPKTTPKTTPPKVESDVSGLEAQRDKLESEIDVLASQQSGIKPVVFRKTEEERRRDELSSEQIATNIQAKKDQLRSLLADINKRKAGAAPEETVEAAPMTPSPTKVFDPMRGPVFPDRTLRRADEKVRQAETGVYTAERMLPGMHEYVTSGEHLRETTLPVADEPTQRRYAVGRRREGLRRMLGMQESVTQPNRSMLTKGLMEPFYEGIVRPAGAIVEPAIDVASRVPAGLAGGYIRSAMTGEPIPGGTNLWRDERYGETRDDFFPLPEYAPERPQRGGQMFAPRGQADPQRVNEAIVERSRQIAAMKREVAKLRGLAQEERRPADSYARIAAYEDGIEQLQAELVQLERVKRVTIPRREYEQSMAGSGIVTPEDAE